MLVQTHHPGYVGHYRLKLIDFSPTQLVVAIERKSNTHVEVTYALDAALVQRGAARRGHNLRPTRLKGPGSNTVTNVTP